MKNSLILIIAAMFALPIHAAKMCASENSLPNDPAISYAYTTYQTNRWAVGYGCPGTDLSTIYTGDDNGLLNHNNIFAACSIVSVIGNADCRDDDMCYCRIIFPKTSGWLSLFSYAPHGGKNSCMSWRECMQRCAKRFAISGSLTM